MPNIVCYTQDVPGEREWINSCFPGYINLETESAGRWNTNTAVGNFIREIPFTDPLYNYDFDTSVSVKTVYNNSIDLIINDNSFMSANELLFNDQIKFSNTINDQNKKYMMFTLTRCGTMFTESLLQKKYQMLKGHYSFANLDKRDIAENCHDNDILICLNYRSNWWSWVTSCAIGQANAHLTERGALHCFDDVDWNQLITTKITADIFDYFEKSMLQTFNFWCQLRVIYPTRQFSLFRFEDILPIYKTQTNHTQVPYNKTSLISNYNETKDLFEKQYLKRWQAIEQKFLKFFEQMAVVPTTTI